ncbi:MAG: sulfatase [Deltaproteobacteria bacterium]|nr:sulfatase [Deltaproteobacteria bacterium]
MPIPAPRISRKRTRAIYLLLVCLLVAMLMGCGRKPTTPQLLLLITVDTLRADRLGAYGSDLGLTPNLDALAEDSVVFTAAYAAAPFTLPSVSALMTGRHPEALGIFRNESVFPASVPTLASELNRYGWKTRAVVSNFILRHESGIASGFETFDDEFPQVEIVRKWPERVAPDTTEAALALLDDCVPDEDSHCFLWVHYQDPHGPYTPPEALHAAELAREEGRSDSERLLPVSDDHTGIGAIPNYQIIDDRRDVGFYRAGYHAEIRYLDGEIGRLLEAIEERGLGRRTLIAFTADHGEGLGENDYWFAHGEYLNDSQLHVPLMFRVAGRAPERRNDVASLTDVFHTLLAASIDFPLEPEPAGRDLLAANAEQTPSRAYSASLGGSHQQRHGLIDGEYRLVITQRDGIGDARLTNRSNDIDLSAAAPQIAKPMRNRLNRIRARLARGLEETLQDLSDEERKSLEALGYVGETEP